VPALHRVLATCNFTGPRLISGVPQIIIIIIIIEASHLQDEECVITCQTTGGEKTTNLSK